MITHLKRNESDGLLHLSHLHKYISAYEPTVQMQEVLAKDIDFAIKEAKKTVRTQIVSLDGECCLHVTPAKHIILMLPWKEYIVGKIK
jgi:GTP cyclohydrolase I